VILFPDSHFFLHYRHPPELPWPEVGLTSQVVLMVGRTVQKELEKHKFGLRGRPQDRARNYAAKLGEIVTTRSPLVLREASPTILLDFAPRPPGWSAPSDLDPGWQDDQLIADALAYVAGNPGKVAAVLTGDSGVLATAKAHGLNVISIAGRGWELPPEPSPLEKELEKLKRENAELKRKGPNISCELRAGDEKLDAVQLKSERFPPLSPDDVDELVNAVRVAHPEATEFDKATINSHFDFAIAYGQAEWVLPTPEAIEAYRQSYSQWIADLKTFVADTHLRLAMPTRAVSVDLDLIICNEGVEPADGVIVSIETVGGFLLSQIKREEGAAEPNDTAPVKLEPYRGPPTPPRPVRKIIRPSYMDPLGNLADQYRLAMRGIPTPIVKRFPASLLPPIHKPRDRHKFYWRDTNERDGVARWQFECAEFQHCGKPEPFSLRIVADSEDGCAHRGALEVKVFARNLRKPFARAFRVQLDATEGDTASRVRALMPRALWHL